MKRSEEIVHSAFAAGSPGSSGMPLLKDSRLAVLLMVTSTVVAVLSLWVLFLLMVVVKRCLHS